jgi:5-methylcytosine-specific restriction endonuclease McrA
MAAPKRHPLRALQPRALGSLPPKVTGPAKTERLSGWQGEQMRKEIRERDGFLCQACKREGIVRAGYDVDHIVSLDDFGTNAKENQELLCRAHHASKTAEENRRRMLAAPPIAR